MSEKVSNGLTSATAQLRGAFGASPLSEVDLRSAVCAFVDSARAQGWPVERVIVEVKRIAEVEEGPVNRWTNASDRLDGQRLVTRAVSWCVQHYFRDAPGRDA